MNEDSGNIEVGRGSWQVRWLAHAAMLAGVLLFPVTGVSAVYAPITFYTTQYCGEPPCARLQDPVTAAETGFHEVRRDCSEFDHLVFVPESSSPQPYSLWLIYETLANCPNVNPPVVGQIPYNVVRMMTCDGKTYSYISENDNPVCLSVGADDRYKRAGKPLSCPVGNPIDAGSGNKYHVETEYAGKGVFPITFSWTYNSSRYGALAYNTEPLGYNRAHYYNRRIDLYTTNPVSGPLSTAYALRPDGKTLRFTYKAATASWESDGDIHDTLEQVTDATGAVTGWQYHTAEDEVELYDSTGRLSSITDVRGNSHVLAYSQGLLTRVESNEGESLQFAYDAVSRIQSMVDGSGRIWGFRYNGDNRLRYVDKPDGTTKEYLYEEQYHPNALTGIVDERGIRYATYKYLFNGIDSQGLAIESYHGPQTGVLTDRIQGVSISYAYDANGTRTLVNSNGHTTTYSTAVGQGVRIITDAAGPGCSTCASGNTGYDYDPANNNLLTKTINGVTIEYGNYDAKGNPGFMIEAKGTAEERRTDYTFDSRYSGRIASKTELSVRTGFTRLTSYSYDDYGNRTSETIDGYAPDHQGGWIPVSRTTRWKYGGSNPTDCPESEVPFHQLCEIDGPRNDVDDITKFRYWPFDHNAQTHGPDDGRLKEVEDAGGKLIRHDIHYTATGKVWYEFDANNVMTGYEYYPGNDRLMRMGVFGNGSPRYTEWTYLATGEVETITTAPGGTDASTITFAYDDARRLVRTTDGMGNYIAYTLDTEGNKLKEEIFDASGTPADELDDVLTRVLTRIFDIYNRPDLIKLGGDPNNPLETVDPQNNPDGTLAQSKDGSNTITAYSYDALKRLLATTQDQGGTDPATANALTQYDYDVADHLIRIADPVSGTTTHQYDDLGNLLSTVSPDTGVTAYTSDDAGNVTSKTTAAGTAEAVVVNYSHDALNRLVNVTTPDPGENISYAYDSCLNGAGRLCTVANGTSMVSYGYDGYGNVTTHQGMSYTYDSANRVSTVTYPSGAVVTYGYDPAGQISSVDLTVNGQTRSLASGITYVPFGGTKTLTYGNSLVLTRQWDAAYRLTSQSIPGILSLDYPVYDANGNLTRLDDTTITPGFVSTFGYDRQNRLDYASGPFGSGWDYDYDRNGNRLQSNEGVAITLAYGSGSNRLDTIGSDDVILDVAGNTLTRGGWTYSYTPHYRLKDADDGAGIVASFAYNGLGQRVEKNPASSYSKRFFYGLNGELLVETGVNGYPLVEYIYLNDQLLAVYHPDADNNGETNLQAAGAGNPLLPPDTDGDGLTDIDELLIHGTSPANPDTDGDGVNDGTEVSWNTGPLDPNDFILPGDINVDGQVDLADYLLMSRYLTGSKTPTANELNAADMNRNSRMDAGDAVIMMRKVLGMAWGRISAGSLSKFLLTAWEGLFNAADAAVTQGRLYYVHTDHLGTPQVMTDDNGNVVWRALYDPFGKATISVNTVELNVRFPGQYYDRETGLHYNCFRYYDPEVGRYITSDPMGIINGADLNLFSYAGNDPINWVDPLGQLRSGRNARYFTNVTHHVINGNLFDGFSHQDGVCTQPADKLNSNPCTKQCCLEHDMCYERFRCNASSWIGNLLHTRNACQLCNLLAAKCVIENQAKSDCDAACDK